MMNRQAFVCLYHDLSEPNVGFRVHIERDDSLVRRDSNGWILCSQSPIFPLLPDPFVPNMEGTYRIIFIVHEEPFLQFGKLPSDIAKYFWYSLGVTSQVAVLPPDISNDQFFGVLDASQILCHETWMIKNGALEKTSITFAKSNTDQFDTSWTRAIPANPDLVRLIHELHLNFNSLIKRARILMPSLLPVIKQVRESVAREIGNIVQDESLLRETTIRSDTVADVVRCLATHKQINVSVDALVQLNSALAYILSQSFYGGPPLAQNLALNSRHSLLGIGTAITAIQKLTEFIIEGFGELPLAKVIKNNYHDVTLEHYFTDDNSQLINKTADFYIETVGRSDQTPKLAYFSARMGFSEHGYCVTAATQSLSSADATRRNLLTLTHELLHSHVKGLFASILVDARQRDQHGAALPALVRQYRQMAKEYEQDQLCQRKWTVLQFLRFRIFVFCDSIYEVVSKYPGCQVTEPPVQRLDYGVDANDDAELERFKSAFGFLNEVVVHILDLHYFYDESESIYFATLWRSWATVPGVADKIEWYILRGIVAASVSNMYRLNRDDFGGLGEFLQPDSKTLDSRFEDAINTLVGILDELCDQIGSEPMLRAVLAKLNNQAIRLWLREAFFPCHLFGQIVKQFLYSQKLREYFDSFKDPLADLDEDDEPVYALEAFDFPRSPVRNPIAFLRDRLRRDINGDNSSDEEARSAWLFLGLASISRKIKENEPK